MKKILSIILLAAMLLYSVGYYLVYRYNIGMVKQQMKQAVAAGKFSARELVHFTIDLQHPQTAAGVEVEDGKEIRYKGKMYDIVSVQFANNTLVVSCLPDKDETEVLSNFTRYLQSEDGAIAGKKTTRFIKFNFPLFTVALSEAMPGKSQSATPGNYAFFRPVIILHRYINIPSPPPWA